MAQPPELLHARHRSGRASQGHRELPRPSQPSRATRVPEKGPKDGRLKSSCLLCPALTLRSVPFSCSYSLSLYSPTRVTAPKRCADNKDKQTDPERETDRETERMTQTNRHKERERGTHTHTHTHKASLLHWPHLLKPLLCSKLFSLRAALR